MTNFVYKDLTIPINTSLTNALDTEGLEVATFYAPAELTGTTLTVKSSDSITGTFNARKINGDAISLTIAGGEEVQFNPPLIGAAFKFDTGANEVAARAIKIGVRQFQ